jgi:hypothetical protein
VHVQVPLDEVLDLRLLLAVKTRDAVYGRLKQLFDDDAAFRDAFYDALFDAWRQQSDNLQYRLSEFEFAEGEKLPEGKSRHFPE